MPERCHFLDGDRFPEDWVAEAVEVLDSGGVLAHPTETVHGFGCRADNVVAVGRIQSLKGRDPGKGMILLIPGLDWITELCGEPRPEILTLARAFWPGPLTVVSVVAHSVRKRFPWLGESVALRQTPHPFTSRVVDELGRPMVSTSLNRSGEPPVTDPLAFLQALELSESLAGGVDLAVIDRAEKIRSGSPQSSTVVAAGDRGGLVLLREGAISAARIQARTGLEFQSASN